jgi:hypothetical protein
MDYECQGIGRNASCGKNATREMLTMGVGTDGNIAPKTVYLCDFHFQELGSFWRKQKEEKS